MPSCEIKRPSDAQEEGPRLAKRPRPNVDGSHGAAGPVPGRRREDYSVGWVCALWMELAAAEGMLDEIHQPLPRVLNDTNSYTLGNIGPHNIAIACLPKGHYGTNNAATVAANIHRSFPSINIRLMVGIGGGVPGSGSIDLRLGDVVVGEQVIQYDLGKAMPDDHFQRTGLYIRPPASLMTNASKLQARHAREDSRISSLLSDMVQRHPKLDEYSRPSPPDRLFRNTYPHTSPGNTCDGCDQGQLVARPKRANTTPKILYGKIASGNEVVKDSVKRDKLQGDLGIICLEMEAAGLVDSFPCLVIRGICDYADSHKAKNWQKYAAATAAAYAKEFLLEIPGSEPCLRPADPVAQVDVPEPASSNDDLRPLLESLDFDQKESRHTNIKSAFPKTCRWFPSHANYLRWLDPQELPNHHGFLWLDGKAGAGKSTVMKYAFDTTKELSSESEPEHAVIAFFFNARGDSLEKSTEGMYRSLLLQAFECFPDLRKTLTKYLYKARKLGATIEWDLDTLQAIFTDVTRRLGSRSLTCFVDALDECDDEQVLAMVEHFEELGERAFLSRTHLFICFSSRPYPHIEINKCIRFTLEDESEHGDDIEKYVRGKLKAGKGRSKAATEVRDEILSKSAGVFMWVVLVVEILNEEFRDGRIFQVKKRLQELPPKLSDLFKNILCRDRRNMDDLLLCVQWILFAKRPLSCEEYYFALQTDLLPDEALREWDREYVTREDMKRYVLSSSKGLAEVAKSRAKQTVQFIHESVRDYLIKDNGIRDLWPDLEECFEERSHDRLKHICHTYATMDLSKYMSIPRPLPKVTNTEDLKTLRFQVAEKFPLMEYASHHVLYHAESASNWSCQLDFTSKLSWTTLSENHNIFEKLGRCRINSSSGLVYILAQLGHTELLKRTMTGHDMFVVSEGEKPEYPIFAALENGHLDMVHHILVQKLGLQDARSLDIAVAVSRNFLSTYGTPLHWAAGVGNILLFKHILGIGVWDLRSVVDPYRHGVLSVAAREGCQELVKFLLSEERALVWERDCLGDIALHSACGNGHVAVVKTLLESDEGGIDMRDKRGSTPLSYAARAGHSSVAQLLLATGKVDINNQTKDGRTSLIDAAELGHLETVQVLLADENADVTLRDGQGYTALKRAACEGHQEVVRLLLATKNATITDPNQVDYTTLMLAVVRRQKKIVQLLLLEDESLDINARRKGGFTALMHAAITGNKEIVQLLLKKEEIFLDCKDDYGRTSLSYAAESWSTDVVQLLLETGSVDVKLKDNKGHSPLWWAAKSGWRTTVELLLRFGYDREELLRSVDIAKRSGHKWVVELLGSSLQRLGEIDAKEINVL